MRQSHTGTTTSGADAIPDPKPGEASDDSFTMFVRGDMTKHPSFQIALWREIQTAFDEGDTVTGISLLRDYFPDVDPTTVMSAAGKA